MTLADINTALQAQLPDVTLSPVLFDNDPGLTPLLQMYFFENKGAVQIQVTAGSYSFDQQNGVITFAGVGQSGPFKGLPLPRVFIKMVNGAPQFSIKSQPPDDITLDTLFPALDAPVLLEMPCKNVSFYWDSYDSDADQTLQGFYFQGELDFGVPPLNILSFIFSDPGAAPTLWGQIKFQGTATGQVSQFVPDMILIMDSTTEEAKLGPFTLEGPKFQITSNPFFNTSDLRWQTGSKIQVSAPVAFKDDWFLLSLDLNNTQGAIVFDAQLDIPLGGALEDIVALLGNTPLSVPQFTIANTQDLLLKDIIVSYNTQSSQIDLISVDVGMAPEEKWQLWGQVFLEQILVNFQLTPKSGGSGYDVGGMIFGVVSDWLALSAAFSTDGNYSFTGRLNNPDQPLTMQQLYTFFTGDQSVQDFPNIEITTFYFELDRSPDGQGGSNYHFEGDVVIDGEWDLLATPTKISINQLNFHLERQPDKSVNFKAGGIFGISDYSLALEAEYDTNMKWVFSGDLELSEEKPGIADMNAKIDGQYPNKPSKPANIPPFLSDWYVQSLITQYATQSKNLDFNMSIKNSAYAWLEMDFGIHLIHSDTAFDKKLDGAIKIDTQIDNKPLQAEFDLSFDESDSTDPQPVKTYTMLGNYVTNPQSAPSLSDFLLYLAQNNPLDSNLPTEIDFDAAMEGFAIEVQKTGDGNTTVELAGTFEFQIEKSTWDLYFAYTNDVKFDAGGGSTPPAGDPAAAPFVFGVALGGLIDLSHLPLVGKIPGIDKFRIDKLGFFYTNATFTDQNKKLQFKVPAVGDPGQLAPNPTEAYLVQSGFSLMAVFGNQQETNNTPALNSAGTMPLPVNTGTPAPGQAGFSGSTAAPKDPVKWLELNKTLGPVSLEKIGIAYGKAPRPDIQLGTVGFYVDGSFKIGGFEMALDRLGLSFNIPKPNTQGATFDPMRDIGFHLGGLFVQYQAPDFQISGGFVSLPDDTGVNFIGEFTVLAGPFGLQAYGGFSNDLGNPSLFIFLHLNAPIGGPPFFFVNGLAGGFGVNRGFVLPTFDQLTGYPFLPSSSTIPTASDLSGSAASQLQTMSTALTNLARYVPVQNGAYWFALGLDVSSFEMIQVSAVLSVAFGVKFQVGLVGSASMTLPVQEPEPIAYIQIDFEVDFSPADGLIAAFGKITPASFVFAKFVHLSGGFAFYTWFDGPHKGDFVVTIGGYHPAYQKPDYYPTVPRMQVGFALGNLVVSGQAYFALTGNAIMAGLAIHATWSLGPISAWFDAGIDFLIGWKPFHYEADAYVEIGVALTIKVLFVHIRISISVGVMLEIWGPSFGGQARIDLYIVSFTIRFGADQTTPPPVDWSQFKQFLPNLNSAAPSKMTAAAAGDDNPPLVNITVPNGLSKTYKPGESPEGFDWLLDANGFEIQSQTIAPSTDASFNGGTSLKTYTAYLDPDNLAAGIENAINNKQQAPYFAYKPATGDPVWNTLNFGIAPMALTNIQAIHSVSIQALDDSGQPGAYVTDLILVLQTGTVQTALWGNKGAHTISLKGSDSVIKGVLNGFSILPNLWFPARTAFISYYYLVFDTNDLFLEQDAMPAFNTNPVSNPSTVYENLENGTAFSGTTAARSEVLTLLQQTGLDYLTLQNDGSLNTDQYVAEPILAYLS